MMKRTGFLARAAALGLGARATAALAADTYTLRMSIPLGQNSLMFAAGAHWASALQRRSGGRLAVEIYPSGNLAREIPSVDGLRTGTIDLTVQSASILSQFVPRTGIFDFPFMFRNSAAVYRVFDSPLMNQLESDLE